jgi:hypothetical protein
MPMCRTQALKIVPIICNRLREPRHTMADYIALCQIYVEAAQTAFPEYRDSNRRIGLLNSIKTEAERT